MMPSSSSSEAKSEEKFSVIVPVMKLPVVGPALPPPWQAPPPGLPLMQTFRSPPRPSSDGKPPGVRSEEHTSELQSLMRISYAVFCLKKKITTQYTSHTTTHIDTQQHTIQHTTK